MKVWAGYGSLSNGRLLRPTPVLARLISCQSTILIGCLQLQLQILVKSTGFIAPPPLLLLLVQLQISVEMIGSYDWYILHSSSNTLSPFFNTFLQCQCWLAIKCEEPPDKGHATPIMRKVSIYGKSSRAAAEHKFSAIYHLSPLAIPSSSIPGITGSHLCVQVSAHMSQTY